MTHHPPRGVGSNQYADTPGEHHLHPPTLEEHHRFADIAEAVDHLEDEPTPNEPAVSPEEIEDIARAFGGEDAGWKADFGDIDSDPSWEFTKRYFTNLGVTDSREARRIVDAYRDMDPTMTIREIVDVYPTISPEAVREWLDIGVTDPTSMLNLATEQEHRNWSVHGGVPTRRKTAFTPAQVHAVQTTRRGHALQDRHDRELADLVNDLYRLEHNWPGVDQLPVNVKRRILQDITGCSRDEAATAVGEHRSPSRLDSGMTVTEWTAAAKRPTWWPWHRRRDADLT